MRLAILTWRKFEGEAVRMEPVSERVESCRKGNVSGARNRWHKSHGAGTTKFFGKTMSIRTFRVSNASSLRFVRPIRPAASGRPFRVARHRSTTGRHCFFWLPGSLCPAGGDSGPAQDQHDNGPASGCSFGSASETLVKDPSPVFGGSAIRTRDCLALTGSATGGFKFARWP